MYRRCGLLSAAVILLLLSSCGDSTTTEALLCAPGVLDTSLSQERFHPEKSKGGEDGIVWIQGRPHSVERMDSYWVAEGDILLGSAETPDADPNASIVMSYAGRLWPGGIVPYEIDPSLPSPNRVTYAISHWNSRLGGVVKLVPQTSEPNWAYFARSSSAGTCSSSVGRIGGRQSVLIGLSCGTGNIIHEIGHLLGLWHEQSRPDRDRHVMIHWENVDSSQTSQFGLTGAWGVSLSNYDYGSVMHYPADAFSANGQPTIETVPPGTPIGQRISVSPGDASGVMQLYGLDTSAAIAKSTPPAGCY